MKKTFQIVILSAVVFSFCNLSADVYLLGRGGRESAVGSFTGVGDFPLHTEKVLTNGRQFTLEVYKSRQRFDEIYKKLFKKQNKSTKVSTNGKLIRYRCELPDKKVEHLLFADNGESVLIFRILLPRNFSAGKIWHNELPPLPGGAESELVLELPQRKSVFGMFNNAFGTPQGNLRAVLSNLSEEWHVTADESMMPEGRGAMLVGKKNSVMLIGFSEDGTGFFYLKK